MYMMTLLAFYLVAAVLIGAGVWVLRTLKAGRRIGWADRPRGVPREQRRRLRQIERGYLTCDNGLDLEVNARCVCRRHQKARDAATSPHLC